MVRKNIPQGLKEPNDFAGLMYGLKPVRTFLWPVEFTGYLDIPDRQLRQTLPLASELVTNVTGFQDDKKASGGER